MSLCASMETSCGGCDTQFCGHCKGEENDVKCQGWDCENPNFCVDCCNEYDTCSKHLRKEFCKKCSGSTECESWECEKV